MIDEIDNQLKELKELKELYGNSHTTGEVYISHVEHLLDLVKRQEEIVEAAEDFRIHFGIENIEPLRRLHIALDNLKRG